MENLDGMNKFEIFKAYIENEKELRIKFLRSDWGGELISKDF